MASVQVRILQSGRSDEYGLPLTPGSVATVDRDYAVSLVSTGFASWVNLADAYDGETNLGKPSETYVLFQSGIPFWLPPGDGGSNGLIFDGLRGTFTLSAAILTGFGNLLKTPTGGYCYLPAGSGGLASGGWYFFRMITDTAGEVFKEMYVPGSGVPTIPETTTTHPDLTATRITQTTAEVIAVSFTMPGGSLGPNGIIRGTAAQRGNNNSGTRYLRVKAGATSINVTTISTSGMDLDYDFVRQNQGVQTAQIGNRTSNGWLGQAQSVMSAEPTAIDTSVDQTITTTLQTDTATNSILGWLREFAVKYGA